MEAQMLAMRSGRLPVTIMFGAGAACFGIGMFVILSWPGLLVAIGITLLIGSTPAITVAEANWKSKEPAAFDETNWEAKQPIKLS
jgi:hypothetical protein